MHHLFHIGTQVAAVTRTDLSEPPEIWLAIMFFALILLRRRPFARSQRHPKVTQLLGEIASAKQQILAPLKRLRRSADAKPTTQPWVWMGFESLEGRQLMSGSPPSPASAPPPQIAAAIEQNTEASTPKSASSPSPQKNRESEKAP